MLVPLSWLEEFVRISVRPEKLAEKLLFSGTKVEEISKINGETVLNLEITPNRPDTLSIYGVAREVAALLGEDLKEPDADLIAAEPSRKPLALKISDKKLCPAYSVVALGGVFVKESPDWMKDYLVAAGVRSINNVVDVTNFVMLELGQPMHAFDTGKIGVNLTLRGAKKGEKVTTLDSIQRELPEGAIIIEDSEKLVDLAGLMGGENSEVDENTKEILLLVPLYDPVAIRKASLFTNLRTEASNRFEKKLDPTMHPTAARRAVKLLIENANARLTSQITSFGAIILPKTLEFNLSLVKEVLGITLSTEDLINLLTPLGFRLQASPLHEESLSVSVPAHRTDIIIPEDILEEIGRTFGYNNFPKTLPR